MAIASQTPQSNPVPDHSGGCHVGTTGICTCSLCDTFAPLPELLPITIGLSGLAGSGKSTAAEHLVKRHRFTRAPFAYTLKHMLRALDVPGYMLDGDKSVKEMPLDCLDGHTIRQAAQTLGTEWGRECMGKDFWVNVWRRRLGATPRVVADDVRFENEYAAIKSRGGYVVRVVRPGAGSAVGASHSSENVDAVPYDYLIKNTGSVDDFVKQVDWMVRSLEDAETLASKNVGLRYAYTFGITLRRHRR